MPVSMILSIPSPAVTLVPSPEAGAVPAAVPPAVPADFGALIDAGGALPPGLPVQPALAAPMAGRTAASAQPVTGNIPPDPGAMATVATVAVVEQEGGPFPMADAGAPVAQAALPAPGKAALPTSPASPPQAADPAGPGEPSPLPVAPPPETARAAAPPPEREKPAGKPSVEDVDGDDDLKEAAPAGQEVAVNPVPLGPVQLASPILPATPPASAVQSEEKVVSPGDMPVTNKLAHPKHAAALDNGGVPAAGAEEDGASGAAPSPAAASQAPAQAPTPAPATAPAPAPAPAADRADGTLPSPLLTQIMTPPASRPVASPYPSSPQAAVHAPVVQAQPGRIGADIGVEIARAAKGGRDDLLIRLDPREMGRIDVRLSFDRDGMLRAVMSADSPAALDMLRRESGDLNRALTDAGIRSDAQSLRFDARSGGQGQGNGQGPDWQRGQQERSDGPGLAGESAGELAGAHYRQLRASGQIDLMA